MCHILLNMNQNERIRIASICCITEIKATGYRFKYFGRVFRPINTMRAFLIMVTFHDITATRVTYFQAWQYGLQASSGSPESPPRAARGLMAVCAASSRHLAPRLRPRADYSCQVAFVRA